MLKKIGIGLAIVGVLLCAMVGFLWYNAGAFIGPAHPEVHGRTYLEEKNYPPTVIDQVIALGPLDAATLERLAGEDSTDVRFLVAQNPRLSAALLEKLTRDESDFVRGGAAQNPHLTPEQIRRLSADESHTTQAYLASNPHVPEADLLRLHEEYGIGLVWFAMNPKCPPVLQQKMRDLKDEDALYWLEHTLNSADEPPEAEEGAPRT